MSSFFQIRCCQTDFEAENFELEVDHLCADSAHYQWTRICQLSCQLPWTITKHSPCAYLWGMATRSFPLFGWMETCTSNSVYVLHLQVIRSIDPWESNRETNNFEFWILWLENLKYSTLRSGDKTPCRHWFCEVNDNIWRLFSWNLSEIATAVEVLAELWSPENLLYITVLSSESSIHQD